MTAIAGHATKTTAEDQDLLGILQVTIPVTDLARSAAWYRDLLDLSYVREFANDSEITGCALADWRARFFIALRLRSDTVGMADLRGEHPVIIEVADEMSADRIRDRAAACGISSTGGTHADATWIEFVDPDGIAVRLVHSAAGPQAFMGVHFAGEAATFYDTPRLGLTSRARQG